MARTARILWFFTMMGVTLSLLLTVHQEVVSAASQSSKSKRLLGIRPECLSLRLNPLNRSCCQSYQIDPCNPSPSCGAQTLSERQRYLECCAPNGIQGALGCL